MCSVAELVDDEPRFDCLPPHCHAVKPIDECPKSYKKAMLMYNGGSWKAACEKEMKSLKDKHVWTLVERPVDRQIIQGMWLFKRKPLVGGGIKHKARYVAMGNTQVEGVNYHETFAPTGKPASFRLLVAIAAIQGWEVHQMDAVTAFLNSGIDEEIYVYQPEGFVDPNHPDKVWRLHKSLYGLKQSPKLWQDDVKGFLVSAGFAQCEIDHCTYIRSDREQDKFTAVYVHVDDLAITGNDIEAFKTEICLSLGDGGSRCCPDGSWH